MAWGAGGWSRLPSTSCVPSLREGGRWRPEPGASSSGTGEGGDSSRDTTCLREAFSKPGQRSWEIGTGALSREECRWDTEVNRGQRAARGQQLCRAEARSSRWAGAQGSQRQGGESTWGSVLSSSSRISALEGDHLSHKKILPVHVLWSWTGRTVKKSGC